MSTASARLLSIIFAAARSRLVKGSKKSLGVDLNRPNILVAFHPATIARDTTREADALFSALATVPEQLLFCYPNADAGSRELLDRAPSFL